MKYMEPPACTIRWRDALGKEVRYPDAIIVSMQEEKEYEDFMRKVEPIPVAGLNGLMFKGVEVIGVSSLLPGQCLVAYRSSCL